MVRRLRPDRNPLRRTADRTETFVMAGLLAAFLAAAPFAAHAADHFVYGVTHDTQQAQLASMHQVPSVLLQNASTPNSAYAMSAGSIMKARWIAPDGSPRTGQILAPSDTVAGSKVMIWVDKSGNPAGPPLQPAEVSGRAAFAAVGAVTALALLCLTVGLMVRRTLNRRRMAAWDADWSATGPLWTSQR
jgi:hypothetical protein